MKQSSDAMTKSLWHTTWLVGALFALLVIGSSIVSVGADRAFAQTNPIVQENQNPGTTSWQVDYNIGTVANDIGMQIKGYGSSPSVDQGQSINFHVTVTPSQTFTIDIYRMGWYGGAGGRFMLSSGPLQGTTQPTCPQDPTTGLTECNWSVAYTLAVPTTWTTGIYLAKLTNAQGFQNYIIFAVRDDDRVADFLYQQPVTTYQAYNNFPDNGATGKSLYPHNSFGPITIAGNTRAVKVSFDRPYGGAGGFDGGGQFVEDQWWERYFISWAESQGYDISYSTDVDTHANGARLLNFKGFLSVGHDEYWSKQMYDAVENARNAGVNLAFFGANAVFYQIRFEPSSTNVPNRVIVNYRVPALDPDPDPLMKTTYWRDVNRAEQQLIGVQYVTDGSFINTLPYYISNPTHWVWSNSGFTEGSSVPGLLGYEVDKLFTEYPQPPSVNYTVLANSIYTSTNYFPNVVTPSQSAIYQTSNGSWVFSTGTMAWPWALNRPGYISAGIRQATKNVLDRFLEPVIPPPPTPTPTATPPPNCSGLVREAEVGTLSGAFVIGNDPAASGGQFVHAPKGTGDQPAGPNQLHKATYCFSVTAAGTYHIKGKVYGADTLSDSFYVQMDGTPAAGYLWDVFPNTTYASDYVSQRSGADPVELQLAPGQHFVSIFVREAGTRLDTLELELASTGPGPEPVCAGLVQEAESGALSGPVVVGSDPAASGGQYVHAPNGSGDQWNGPNASRKASYCFNVATSGTYRIKTKVHSADTNSDSFYVQVDGAPVTGRIWDTLINTTYANDFVNDRGVADPVEVQLPTGPHTVTVFVREDGARLDTIQLDLVNTGPPPDPVCAGLLQEAESGSLSGAFEIANDGAASGGQYVTTAEEAGDVWNGPNEQHKAAYCFNVPAAGNYWLRSKVYGADTLSDSFFVKVDNSPAAGMIWDILPNTSYLPDFVNNRNVADPVQVVLASGPHTVTVYLREDAARMDTIELVPVIQTAVVASREDPKAKKKAAPVENVRIASFETVAQGVGGFIHLPANMRSAEPSFAGFYVTLSGAKLQGRKRYSQQIAVDRVGYFRFDGVPSGEYLLKVDVPNTFTVTSKQLKLTVTPEKLVEVSIDVMEKKKRSSKEVVSDVVKGEMGQPDGTELVQDTAIEEETVEEETVEEETVEEETVEEVVTEDPTTNEEEQASSSTVYLPFVSR